MPMPPYNGPQYQYMGPNTYGPYPTVPMQPTFQAPQTPTQPQPPIQTTTLPGRVIKPNETVTPQEVPMDGTASVFPVSDWSAVYVKTWTGDGQIRTIRYVPEAAAEEQKPDTTLSDQNKELDRKVSQLMDSLTD